MKIYTDKGKEVFKRNGMILKKNWIINQGSSFETIKNDSILKITKRRIDGDYGEYAGTEKTFEIIPFNS